MVLCLWLFAGAVFAAQINLRQLCSSGGNLYVFLMQIIILNMVPIFLISYLHLKKKLT